MRTHNSTLTIRISDELLERVKLFASENSESVTSLVITALTQYIDGEQEKFQKLERRLEVLEELLIKQAC